MGKRSRFEIGRFAAAILAVILIGLIPVRSIMSFRADAIDSRISLYLDEFTSKAKKNGCIKAGDYEDLLTFFDDLGFRFNVSIGIEREAESIAGSVMYTAGHIHGPECYAGHNHKASGCRHHTHSSECMCGGSFTEFSWNDLAVVICPVCYGRGKTGNIEVCPSCNGIEPDWQETTCPICGGSGEAYQDIWHICTACNGAGCDICDEGTPGGWYKNELARCKGCRGTGKVLEKNPCSTCGGAGTVGEIVICTVCGGAGSDVDFITHYKCSECGEGDSEIFGSSCDRLVCGFDFESYECGIVNEDTTPRCDRIIVDAVYNRTCSIRQYDPSAMADTTIMLTYLNGSRRAQRAQLVNGGDSFDSSVPGILNMWLSYTGYYESADNYETRMFPIRIEVVPVMTQCEKCGRTYYLNKDGNDPGCPYCTGDQLSLRVTVKGDVIKDGEPDIDVYAVYDQGEQKLDKTEYEVFCDTGTRGEQQAAVFYKGIWEYFVMRVVDENETSSGTTGIPIITDDPGNSGPSGSTGASGNTGSSENTGSTGITNTPDITAIPGIPIAPVMTPVPEYGGITGGLVTPPENKDEFVIDPDNIEDTDRLSSGKYIYIPNDDIISGVYNEGSYNLLPGDMLNVTVYIHGGSSIGVILQRFIIPSGIEEKYSSGIVI